jgi:hypothetical protein
MSVEKIRARIIASVWQAMAQSEADLSTIPDEQQQELVNKIADNVLVAMNEALDETPGEEPTPSLGQTDGETVLWQGRPFLSIVETYVITDERIKIIKGWLSRDIENFELIRIQDLDINQGVSERMLGIGDITVHGQDPSSPVVVLRNIPNPERVYETLRKAWLEARKRHGLQFREFM